MLGQHLYGLLVATGLGVLVNFIARRTFSSEPLEGVGRWNWYVSLLVQSSVYPFLAIAAWHSHGFSTSWFVVGWSDRSITDMRFEAYFIYSFCGYLLKDMWELRNNKLFVAHHIVCLAASFAALLIPSGVGLFVLVVFLLEFGTLTYN
ncbi:unnamed protein product, partial [Heterosigma akashiwo]